MVTFYVFGDYTLDPRRYELRRAGQFISLQPLQFELLHYLIQHRDRVVSRGNLIEAVWEAPVSDSAIDTCISHVRNAVGDSARPHQTIQTVPGRGFRFVADVGERSERDDVLPPDASQATVDDTARPRAAPAAPLGNAPPLPALVIGRDEALDELKARLGTSSGEHRTQVLTAVQGWPGVGKTTMAAVLAHDSDIAIAFPDGVLWTSLGPTPSLLSALAVWGRALGSDDLAGAETPEEAAARLRALLRDKRMLLIVDDVYEAVHAVPFIVGGRRCATLITTREHRVAHAVAATPDDVYRLDILRSEDAFVLLQQLAPSVVADFHDDCRALVEEMERLPLSIQVAGRLLHVEASRGFDVTGLLTEIREGVKLLNAQAPVYQAEVSMETVPTVTFLLAKSTDRLDAETRDRFAQLGAFAPKPATFDIAAIRAAWGEQDPEPTVKELVDRGLLEPIRGGRFWMHALLAVYADSLLS